MKNILLVAGWMAALAVAAQKKKADLIVFNARIYTVDQRFSTATAIAVANGRIADIGSTRFILGRYEAVQSLNAQGQFMYPGFIDAHTHFYRYALENLHKADLTGTHSWNEVLQRLQGFAREHPNGWLTGFGWDQNTWTVREFPNKEKLDQLFPDRPVVLFRVDGHAVIVNQKALDLAVLTPGYTVPGGTAQMKDGQLTGMLIDNAKSLVLSRVPPPMADEATAYLQTVQQHCFALGLTTVDDCGLDYTQVLFMDSLQSAGQLKIRVYAMLSDAPQNYQFLFGHGKIKTGRMHVQSFKVYADGALGSRGAALLQPYSDRPGWSGFLLSTPAHFDSVARIISEHGFQMCTHAIGDSGNRIILRTYARYLQGKNDLRWRIEHAQVVNEQDIPLFGQYHIIPSVQPTHATSDMAWAGDRLGPQRIRNAYAYRLLLEQNGWIPLGTDFPAEDLSPFKTFYAAVFRMDAQGHPAGGFQKEQALSREQALRGMTIWAAKANFEEQEKGSLEKGKLADFIILDDDLMAASAADILRTRVIATYINGEKVYQKE